MHSGLGLQMLHAVFSGACDFLLSFQDQRLWKDRMQVILTREGEAVDVGGTTGG